MFDNPMTLGELIDYVSEYPDTAKVKFHGVAYDGRNPGDFISWRGSYDCLALLTEPDVMDVGPFLERMKNVDGATFSGYKGGDFTMSLNTPILITHDDSACGPRDANGREQIVGIVGVGYKDGIVHLILEYLQEFSFISL